MNSTLQKTELSFSEGILSMRFQDGAIIDVEDVIYIFCYGIEQSNHKPFGVLFDTSSKHELTEEAIEYFASSPYLQHVTAFAYVSKDLISKIRLNLLMIFERPAVKPKIFADEKEALSWLQQQMIQQLN